MTEELTDVETQPPPRRLVRYRARGTGSVYRQKKSPNFWIQYYRNGRVYRESSQTDNRRKAEKLLQKRLGDIPQVKIIHKVEANGVFAKIPRAAIAKLQKRYFFYVWNEKQSVVRWMCSFDTTEQDVKEFTTLVAQTLGR